MVKLLYAMGGPMVRAGAETMVMRYIREIIQYQIFEVSILVHGDSKEKGDYDDEIESYGIRIYKIPRRGKTPLTYSKNLDEFFRSHRFDIVHCNMDAACGIFLKAAKKADIPVRIAHSHLTTYQATNPLKRVAAIISRNEIPYVATHYFACSKKAGNFLFGDKSFTIINNAIDLNDYFPRIEMRSDLRKHYQIEENELVIGHIGRFCEQKNHKFILQIANECKKRGVKFRMALIGRGPLFETIKDEIAKFDLAEHVMLLGASDRIPDLLQMFDVFVMPSLFEGLPVTGIEAQAAGLPCVFSDKITSEICMTDNAIQLPIDDANIWVDYLQNTAFSRNVERAQEALAKNGYSIQKESKKLMDMYTSMVGEK